MHARSGPASVCLFVLAVIAFLALALSGCAGIPARDPVRLSIVGIEPLPGEGLEIRLNVKLRLQNPNEAPLEYDGVALELEVNGKPFASGVSDQKGTVARFGETVFSVPVTVSAVAALRQVLGLADTAKLDDLPYVLRGKLGGGVFGAIRFFEKGTLSISGMSEASE